MKDYEILKKKYGERFARLCRSLFPTILEQEGVLAELIQSKFAPSKFLYDDIVNNNLQQSFKNYIYGFYDINKNSKQEINETPEELMDRAGYKLYKCKTNEDILKFKKYYQENEELCTFRDPYRIDNYTIFFAVKKNVNEIKRKNFSKPRRQDEYGTSVISLQFTKGEESTLSIKNRYNHTVDNPDATFSNDLENIYAGLTDSFEEYYNIKLINGKHSFEIPNYVMANDGKFYRYNYEINNVYYCSNNIIINNGNVIEYDKDIYEIIDYFIVDKKNCKIVQAPNMKFEDGFIDSVKNLEKIEITKNENNERIFKIVNTKKEETYLTVNKYNQIIKYTNNHIEELSDNFLKYSHYLEEFNAQNLQQMGDCCLENADSLTVFNAQNLQVMGDDCLYNANILKEFNAPNLQEMGNYCLNRANNLTVFNAPNLQKMGGSCLGTVNSLTEFNAPNLQKMGGSCLGTAKSLTEFNAPNLQEMGDFCFYYAEGLKEFNAPNLLSMGVYCLNNVENLKEFNALNLLSMGDDCLRNAESLTEFNAPNLQEMGSKCLVNVNSLIGFYALNLQEMGEYCLHYAKSLTEFNAPSLQHMGKYCLYNAVNLKKFNVPNEIKTGNGCLKNVKNKHIKKIMKKNNELTF